MCTAVKNGQDILVDKVLFSPSLLFVSPPFFSFFFSKDSSFPPPLPTTTTPTKDTFDEVNDVQFQEQQPVKVKGKEGFVQVYTPISVYPEGEEGNTSIAIYL